MVTLQEALTSALRTSFCNTTTNLNTALQLGERIFDLPGPFNLDVAGQPGPRLLRTLNNLTCDRPPEDASGGLTPPFTGGQCVGTRYTISYTLTLLNTDNDQSTVVPLSTAAFGPIVSLVAGPEPFQTSLTAAPGPTDPVTTQVLDTFASNFAVTSVVIDSVVPNAGQPNNCGDPVPVPESYDPTDFTDTVTVDYDDPSGNPTQIQPTFVFAPVTIGAGGELNVPVNITFEDGSSLVGEINLNTGESSLKTDDGNGTSSPLGPVLLNEGIGPENFSLQVIGVKVESTINPLSVRATEILQSGGNPNIWAPRLGYVNFLYENADGSRSWGADIPVKNTNFTAFAARPAVNVRGSSEPGVTFSLRVVVILESCFESCCV